MGGQSGSFTFLKSCEVYDPSTNTWSAISNMGTLRFLACAAASGKIYVMSGYDGFPSTNSWTAISSMGSRLQGHVQPLLEARSTS